MMEFNQNDWSQRDIINTIFKINKKGAGTARARNSFGLPGMGGKRRRAMAAGGRERRPGGRSLRNRVREGGNKRVQRDREAALAGVR